MSMADLLLGVLVFVASLAGFSALSLAMDRHVEDVFGRGSSPGPWKRWLQLGGSALLCLSLAASLQMAGRSTGWVLWLGALTVTAKLTVGLLSYVPRRFHWVASASAAIAVVAALSLGLMHLQQADGREAIAMAGAK